MQINNRNVIETKKQKWNRIICTYQENWPVHKHSSHWPLTKNDWWIDNNWVEWHWRRQVFSVLSKYLFTNCICICIGTQWNDSTQRSGCGICFSYENCFPEQSKWDSINTRKCSRNVGPIHLQYSNISYPAHWTVHTTLTNSLANHRFWARAMVVIFHCLRLSNDKWKSTCNCWCYIENA